MSFQKLTEHTQKGDWSVIVGKVCNCWEGLYNTLAQFLFLYTAPINRYTLVSVFLLQALSYSRPTHTSTSGVVAFADTKLKLLVAIICTVVLLYAKTPEQLKLVQKINQQRKIVGGLKPFLASLERRFGRVSI